MRLLSLRQGDRPWFHLLLLGLTLFSTWFTFRHQELWGGMGAPFSDGIIFSLALVAILGSHEMGHYLLARWHQVDTTLPYFIPVPMVGVGTLGAVIRIRSRIPTRNALVDIGAAGPLAGLAVALPVLVVGYLNSRVVTTPVLPSAYPEEWSLIGIGQALWSAVQGAGGGETQVTAAYTIFGDNLLTLAVQRIIVGPLAENQTVIAHPLVIAGWFGCLVTMLNLIPIGQLDGGHLTYAWFGDKARHIGKVMSAGLLYLALFHSVSWVLWFFITMLVIRYRHPPVVVEDSELSPLRRFICVLCLVAFVLCLMPTPIRMVTLP